MMKFTASALLKLSSGVGEHRQKFRLDFALEAGQLSDSALHWAEMYHRCIEPNFWLEMLYWREQLRREQLDA